MGFRAGNGRALTITSLLRPHSSALVVALIAVLGEGLANLLEPWPLKIVFDDVLRAKPGHGWLNQFILRNIGGEPGEILGFALAAVLAIALLGAISSYTEKYLSTSIGQWVTHDLRRMLYAHV